ncbi:hypothetical protein C8Q79DRAFT_930751 [Trametes meyenii]|nr:hypothetical protein C8Q79DRAFT_930751 [Trametes meyenii]
MVNFAFVSAFMYPALSSSYLVVTSAAVVVLERAPPHLFGHTHAAPSVDVLRRLPLRPPRPPRRGYSPSFVTPLPSGSRSLSKDGDKVSTGSIPSYVVVKWPLQTIPTILKSRAPPSPLLPLPPAFYFARLLCSTPVLSHLCYGYDSLGSNM